MTRILDTEVVRRGYATVTLVTLDDGKGAPHQREVVSFGQSACVLPYDPERKVALVIRLPRAPLLLAGETEQLIETPAGMIEAGEAAAETIRREAFEEVGLQLTTLEPVGVCWPSPGVVAERSHMFLAPYAKQDLKGPGGGLAEEHEGIAPEDTPLASLWRAAEQGALHDMKTLTLVLALRVRRPELFLSR